MAEDGAGDGAMVESIWGRTAPSSHAQRFPPCQAFPLRVAPLWLHGLLHPKGHDAGLDRLVASPPSYPAVLSACHCWPLRQGLGWRLLRARALDCVHSSGSDCDSQLPVPPEPGLVAQTFSSLGYTRYVWQIANRNGSAALGVGDSHHAGGRSVWWR